MTLKPGIFAKVTMPVARYETVILIPPSSVVEASNQNQRRIFVVRENVSKRRKSMWGFHKAATSKLGMDLLKKIQWPLCASIV